MYKTMLCRLSMYPRHDRSRDLNYRDHEEYQYIRVTKSLQTLWSHVCLTKDVSIQKRHLNCLI